LLSIIATAFRRRQSKESAMKSLIHAAVMVGAIVAAMVMTTPAHAQQLDEKLTFTTDFSFIVNGKTMPAGKYELRPLENDDGVMSLTESHGRASVFFDVVPMSGPAPTSNEIVFDEAHHNTYFLHTIRLADESTGESVAGVSRSEDRLTANMTQKHVPAYPLRPATT
jgi:hypothetical protein